MAATIYLILMILLIMVLTLLDDVFSLLLYDLFLIYIGTNLQTVIDIPTGSLVMSEVIIGMLILITLYKIVVVSGKVKKKLGKLSLTEEQ